MKLTYYFGRKQVSTECVQVHVAADEKLIEAIYPLIVPSRLKTIIGEHRVPLFYEDGTPILAEYRRCSGKTSISAFGQAFYDTKNECILDMFFNDKSKGERKLFRFVRFVETRQCKQIIILPK